MQWFLFLISYSLGNIVSFFSLYSCFIYTSFIVIFLMLFSVWWSFRFFNQNIKSFFFIGIRSGFRLNRCWFSALSGCLFMGERSFFRAFHLSISEVSNFIPPIGNFSKHFKAFYSIMLWDYLKWLFGKYFFNHFEASFKK
jgi:hypothetical protein